MMEIEYKGNQTGRYELCASSEWYKGLLYVWEFRKFQ